ncbi:F0F1-type ATP synthase, beta subunit [Thiovulum sp. ES]|nr:F0F1-type ATP synthase, beta subunit [Thiovulum sp. ES]
MIRFITLFLMTTFSLLASGGEEHATDIVERTFNFVIFAGILYYLIAEPIKTFLSDRTLSIENEFKKNEQRIEDSKLEKEKAEAELISAKKQAETIVVDAKNEVELAVVNLEKAFQNDLSTLEKQNKDLKELEERKMVQAVVREEVEKLLSKDGIGLDEESLSKALVKKVS